MLTKQQAQAICEAHEIYELIENEEEMELIEENYPELLDAYHTLIDIATSTP